MLLHADGMSLYGTGATGVTNALAGVWAGFESNATISSVNPRGNGTHHGRADSIQDIFRRVLGGDFGDGIGFGAAYFFSSLPLAAGQFILFQARDSLNVAQFSVTLSTTGTIEVRRGDHTGTIVVQTAAPEMTASAYQHMELFAVCGNAGVSPAGGQIEIRINGETVLNATNIDIQSAATNNVEQYALGLSIVGPNGPVFDFTDIMAWDTSGAVNNDFMGDVQWLRWDATADNAATDWVRNTGASDFSAINQTTPDGDTTYIEATAAGNVSEFDITNCPANTSDIVAVITQPMMRKTDAGAGTIQPALLSSNIGSPPAPAVSNATNQAVTQTYTYYPVAHQTDPATGVRWTPSGFNATRVRYTRTA